MQPTAFAIFTDVGHAVAHGSAWVFKCALSTSHANLSDRAAQANNRFRSFGTPAANQASDTNNFAREYSH